MRIGMVLSLFLLMGNAFASSATYYRTLEKKEEVSKDNLDLVGGMVVTQKDELGVVGHCEERVDTVCTRLTYLLSVGQKFFVLYNGSGEKLSLDLTKLQNEAEVKKYLKRIGSNYKKATSYDDRWIGEPFYLSGSNGMIMVWDHEYYRIALIPFALAGDFLLLPINGVYHLVHKIKAKGHKKLAKKLLDMSEENTKRLSSARFHQFLDTMSPL